MKKYYIYAHSNEKYGVFYVGKGCDERLYKTGNRNAYWKSIVAKHGYTASILEECESEPHAYEREKEWIAKYKLTGQCCANFSLGGDGVMVEKRWWGPKISEALMGVKRKRGEESYFFKHGITRERLVDLYITQDLPSPEVAKALGVSVATVFSRLEMYGIPVKPPPKKAIVCIETGEVYESIADAARKTGLYRENIRKVLAGKYKTTGNLTFKYQE